MGDHSIVIYKHLLNDCFLIFNVDGISRDAVDNDSVGRHDEFGILAESLKPSLVLLELCSFCGRAGEYLDIAALELVCCHDLNRSGGGIIADRGLYLLPNLGGGSSSIALNDAMVLQLNGDHAIFVCRHCCLGPGGVCTLLGWWWWERRSLGLRSHLCP